MEVKSEEKLPTPALLADPRLDRMLTVAQQMNDLKVKIRKATEYIISSPDKTSVGEVQFAREELVREFERNYEEAAELIPAIGEIESKIQEQAKTLEKAVKLNSGLAKIEVLTGSKESSKRFTEVAQSESEQIVQIENLVAALDALEKDLSSRRRDTISCPRCASTRVAYRIQPSDMGFTLYRCGECSNAWRITRYSIQF